MLTLECHNLGYTEGAVRGPGLQIIVSVVCPDELARRAIVRDIAKDDLEVVLQGDWSEFSCQLQSRMSELVAAWYRQGAQNGWVSETKQNG